LSQRDLFLLGLGLYWGEGVKSNTGIATLVNSDPGIVAMGKEWFMSCLGVSLQDFRPYIYVSIQYKNSSGKITSFWSKILNIPKDQFKVIIIKNTSKKIYHNHKEYFGVLQLRVRKGTDLKYRILGLIEGCKTGRKK